MKKIPIRLGGLLGLVWAALALSCPSLVVNEKEVDRVVALIAAGNTDQLEKLTALPFLLDGEIIALSGDAGVLWQSLKAAGITLRGAKLIDLVSVRDDTYKLFADTWEVSVFFKKYVPANAKAARIESASGRYLLLLGGERLDGYARIIGIKVLDS